MNAGSLCTLVGAACMALAGLSEAQAASLRITDTINSNTLIISDNDGADLNPTVGVISFSGPLNASWQIGSATLFFDPFLTTPTQRGIDLSAAVSGTGSLVIRGESPLLSHGSFTQTYGWRHAVGGTSEGEASFLSRLASYIDFPPVGPGSTVFSTLNSGPFIGAAGGTPFADLQTGTWTAFGGKPFELATTAFIDHNSDQITSFNVETTAVVPVPAALPLFATALGLLTLMRRRGQP